MDVLDYEKLVSDFETKLVTQLRGHGAEAEYLEMWVPDEDPVKSILNMVEAAEAFGRAEITVRVPEQRLSKLALDQLVEQISQLGRIDVSKQEDMILLNITGIGEPS